MFNEDKGLVFRVKCIVRHVGYHVFSCQSLLLLNITVLNDNGSLPDGSLNDDMVLFLTM